MPFAAWDALRWQSATRRKDLLAVAVAAAVVAAGSGAAAVVAAGTEEDPHLAVVLRPETWRQDPT